MNNKSAAMQALRGDESQLVNWLFLDLNSFFASCEQQMDPGLRGKPVAVVPGMMDTTCCIAASYEAKAFGVKTGTLVREARRLCPDIIFRTGNHREYVRYHHAVKQAFEEVLPIDEVMSIDEFAAQLIGKYREVDRAVELAKRIKATVRERVGGCLTSSIGLAPNRWLAKVASDMKKPDGLKVIRRVDLPHALHRLKLRDLCGISTAMERRLHAAGIQTLEELTAAPPYLLKAAWGGIEGLRFHAYLRGDDISRPATKTSTLSHQHVLEPALRTPARAYQYARYLLSKAAQRLREKDFYARQLVLQIKWMASFREDAPLDERRGDWGVNFPETQSTPQLLKRLEEIWSAVPLDRKPLRIGVVLCDLVPTGAHQPDLFAAPVVDDRRETALLSSLDRLNNRYGTGTVGFGVVRRMFAGPGDTVKGYDGRIAFQRIPSLDEFDRDNVGGNAMGALRFWRPGQPLPGDGALATDYNALRHRL